MPAAGAAQPWWAPNYSVSRPCPAPVVAVAEPPPESEPEAEAEVHVQADAASTPSRTLVLPQPPGPPESKRLTCPLCSRRLNPASLERHLRICKQVSGGLRATGDQTAGASSESVAAAATPWNFRSGGSASSTQRCASDSAPSVAKDPHVNRAPETGKQESQLQPLRAEQNVSKEGGRLERHGSHGAADGLEMDDEIIDRFLGGLQSDAPHPKASTSHRQPQEIESKLQVTENVRRRGLRRLESLPSTSETVPAGHGPVFDVVTVGELACSTVTPTTAPSSSSSLPFAKDYIDVAPSKDRCDAQLGNDGGVAQSAKEGSDAQPTKNTCAAQLGSDGCDAPFAKETSEVQQAADKCGASPVDDRLDTPLSKDKGDLPCVTMTEMPAEDIKLEACENCGRSFNPVSLEKHRAICIRVFGSSISCSPSPRGRRTSGQSQSETPLVGSMRSVGSSTILSPRKPEPTTALAASQMPLQPCPHCARLFRPSALDTHAKVCRSVFPMYDTRSPPRARSRSPGQGGKVQLSPPEAEGPGRQPIAGSPVPKFLTPAFAKLTVGATHRPTSPPMPHAARSDRQEESPPSTPRQGGYPVDRKRGVQLAGRRWSKPSLACATASPRQSVLFSQEKAPAENTPSCGPDPATLTPAGPSSPPFGAQTPCSAKKGPGDILTAVTKDVRTIRKNLGGNALSQARVRAQIQRWERAAVGSQLGASASHSVEPAVSDAETATTVGPADVSPVRTCVFEGESSAARQRIKSPDAGSVFGSSVTMTPRDRGSGASADVGAVPSAGMRSPRLSREGASVDVGQLAWTGYASCPRPSSPSTIGASVDIGSLPSAHSPSVPVPYSMPGMVHNGGSVRMPPGGRGLPFQVQSLSSLRPPPHFMPSPASPRAAGRVAMQVNSLNAAHTVARSPRTSPRPGRPEEPAMRESAPMAYSSWKMCPVGGGSFALPITSASPPPPVAAKTRASPANGHGGTLGSPLGTPPAAPFLAAAPPATWIQRGSPLLRPGSTVVAGAQQAPWSYQRRPSS